MASDSSPSKTAVVGWADLPPELLSIISGDLQNANDIIRFHSVCRSWRSSTAPPLPDKFHTFFPESYTPSRYPTPTPYSIHTTDVYLLRPRRNPSKSFLVSVQQQPKLVGTTTTFTVRHLLTNEAIPGVKSWPSDEWTSPTRIIRSYGYDLPCFFCERPAAQPMKLAFTLKKSDCHRLNYRLVGLCQSKEYRGSALTAFNLPATGLEGSNISEKPNICWNRFLPKLPGKIPADSGCRISWIKGALTSSPRALKLWMFTCVNRVPGECEMLAQNVLKQGFNDIKYEG